MGSMTQMI